MELLTKFVKNFTSQRSSQPAPAKPRPAEHVIILASYPNSGVSWLQNCFLEADIRFDGIPNSFFRFKQPHDELHDEYELTGNVGAKVYLPALTFKEKFNFYHQWMIWGVDHFIPSYNQALEHKIVIMVRDPRDALLSRYYHAATDQDFEDYAKFYAGSWISYHQACINLPNTLFIKFEDAKQNPQAIFKKVLDFCNIPIANHVVETAIANSTSEKARAAEQIYIANTPEEHRHFQVIFNRSGKAKQYESLTEEANAFAYIKEVNKSLMERFDYK